MTRQQKERLDRLKAVFREFEASPYPDRNAIAQKFGMGYHTVRNYHLRWEMEGPGAVQQTKKTGRPKKNPPIVEEIRDLIKYYLEAWQTEERQLREGMTAEEACCLYAGDQAIWKDPADGTEYLINIWSVKAIAGGLVEVEYDSGFQYHGCMRIDPRELYPFALAYRPEDLLEQILQSW
jgi:transposase